MEEVPRSIEQADALRAAAHDSARGLFALCHWNANIDNAWFWRDEHGDIACGLMDWSNVGQINMVTAISSCLAFAEPDFVIEHLDHFLALFARVFEEAGGRPARPRGAEAAVRTANGPGGLQWPLGAVPLIERHIPELATVTDRFDSRIENDEFARTQLHMLTGHLMLWQTSDPRGLIDWAITRGDAVGG